MLGKKNSKELTASSLERVPIAADSCLDDPLNVQAHPL